MALLTDRRHAHFAVGGIGLALLITGVTWIWYQTRPIPKLDVSYRVHSNTFERSNDHSGNNNRMLDRLANALELTPKQREQIAVIQAKTMLGPMSTPPSDPVTWQERDEQMRKARDTMSADIRAVLTPAQQTKYDAIRKRHHNHYYMHGPWGGPPPGRQEGEPAPGGPGMNRWRPSTSAAPVMVPVEPRPNDK